MACGWDPPSGHGELLWPGPDKQLVGKITVCPGYTTALPDVVDIARLYPWAEKGGLQRSELTRGAIDGVDILRNTVGELEAFRIEQMKKEANRGAR